MSFKLLSLSETTDAHTQAWGDLCRTHSQSISHQPWWIRAAADSHNVIDEVSVLHEFDANQALKSIVPLRFYQRTLSGVPIKTLHVGADLVEYHPDWLNNPGQLDALLLLCKEHDCHALQFNNVSDDSQTHTLIDQFDVANAFQAVIKSPGESSPVLNITTDWEAYLTSQPKKWRYNIRKFMRTFDSEDDWQMCWYPENGSSSEFLELLLDIESECWKAEVGTAVLRGQREHLYYENILPVLEEKNALMANALLIKGEPVAYSLCYDWNGRVGSMKTSFKLPYKDISPGTLVYIFSVREAFERQVKSYDFLGDSAQHKQKWSKLSVPHTSYLLVLDTLKGRIASKIQSLRDSIEQRRNS